MKKVAIAFTVLPLVFASAGYVAGGMLVPIPDQSATPDEVSTSAKGDTYPDEGHAAGDSAPTLEAEAALAEDRTIVRLGKVTVPVEKARSVSYVVAEFALKIGDAEVAEEYRDAATAMRIRDTLLEEMQRSAEGTAFRGVSIDSDALAIHLRQKLLKSYPGIEDVLFVSLFKHDVARL